MRFSFVILLFSLSISQVYSQIIECTTTVSDTLEYIVQAKAPGGVAKQTMSTVNADGTAQTDDGYPALGQFYEVPDGASVILNGACFYGYINSGAATTATVKLYVVDGSGKIDLANFVEEVVVNVPLKENYDGGLGTASLALDPSIRICANFTQARTMTSDYVISVENFSDADMIIPGTYSADMDGASEDNVFAYYYWPTDTQFDGWYRPFSEFDDLTWDYDNVIEPIVEHFDIKTTMTIDASGTQVSFATEVLNSANTDLLAHRMYNPNYQTYTSGFDVQTMYDYGDGTTDGLGTHAYTSSANYNINVDHVLWTNVSNCLLEIEVVILGAKDELFAQSIKAYPNPSNGDIMIELGGLYERVHLMITDAAGRQVFEQNFSTTSSIRASLLDFAEGLYIARINTGDRQVALRIMKRE